MKRPENGRGEEMTVYRELTEGETDLSLFDGFDRTQEVTKCLRKENGEWVIKDVPFVDNWSEEEYIEGVEYLRGLIRAGGYAVGAFCDGKLKGFASVENAFFGTHDRYMDLSNIHVSREMRGKGIGRTLFNMAKEWAKDRNADKLYISAHSSVESQAFYKAMGCVEAVEYNLTLAEKEPCDCQLECILRQTEAEK